MCAGAQSSWGARGGGRVKGVAGDQRCTEIGFAPAGAWPRLSHPTRGGAFGRCGELSHCSRAQRPPAGWGSFHPGSRGSSAPRAPALRPRPLVRHLSSERHCQQPRLASWTTPKGTRGLGPKRSKQGGFIPVPFGGDLEQNRKVWGGGGEDSALPSAGFYKRFIWGGLFWTWGPRVRGPACAFWDAILSWRSFSAGRSRSKPPRGAPSGNPFQMQMFVLCAGKSDPPVYPNCPSL